jgi:hypothetical protein
MPPATKKRHLAVVRAEQPTLSLSSAAGMMDAVRNGQGTERPFRCESSKHPGGIDHHASASVNIIKNVWYCYVCHDKGVVDSKAAPSSEALLAMLNPEVAARVYPDSWLDWFGTGYYWSARFSPWVCRMMSLGEDPMSHEGTFPVHTPTGRLAGVGRRTLESSDQGRYIYPYQWAASRSLFGYLQVMREGATVDVVALVEGAADSSAGWEVGCPTLGTYGSGLHWPQQELIMRLAPKLVLTAFDADDAGQLGASRALEQLSADVEVVNVDWAMGGAKDPAAMSCEDRIECLAEAVSAASYSPAVDVVKTWSEAATIYANRYGAH